MTLKISLGIELSVGGGDYCCDDDDNQ